MKPELQQQITQSFDNAIIGLRTDSDKTIAGTAREMFMRIRSREMNVVLNLEDVSNVSTSRFELVGVPGRPGNFLGCIILNPSEVLAISKEKLQADIVRTLHIANQFPNSGYQRPLIDVYREAFMVQEQWMNEHTISEIRVDPRVTPIDRLIQQQIGVPRYYTDTGIFHWQKQLYDYMFKQPHLKPLLDSLVNDHNHFMAAREMYHNMFYKQSVFAAGKNKVESFDKERLREMTDDQIVDAILTEGTSAVQSLSREKIAEMTAAVLVGLTVSANSDVRPPKRH